MMMNQAVEYRDLSPSDYDEIIRVWTEAGLQHRPKGRDSRGALSTEIARTPELFLGAFHDGRMIGTIFGSFDGRRGCVNRLAIVPEHRGRGIAERLVALCEERLRELGALLIFCLIDKENAPSLTLFSKLGYHTHDGIVYLSKRESPES